MTRGPRLFPLMGLIPVMGPNLRNLLVGLFILLAGIVMTSQAMAQVAGIPAFSINEGEGGSTYSLSLQILALMTALTLLPSLVLGMTSFTRIIIVLSILRQAMGTQQTPPNQVLVAIALFLSFFVMQPVLTDLYDNALTPYLEEELPADVALANGQQILSSFMLENTRKNDLTMFADMRGDGPYADDAVPLGVLLPAFITSELKTAFQIGFLIFLPFLVIDMVIASILMALGMMMLSPILVSLPFKLLLFVLVDGWALTMGSLASSFAGG